MADFKQFISGFEPKKELNVLGKDWEQEEDQDDYFGAMTNAERNLNLLTSNVKPMHDFISKNRASLAEQAKTDPAGVLKKISSFGSAYDRGYLKPKNIRSSYLSKLLEDKEWWGEE
jgi:hypothetical protein